MHLYSPAPGARARGRVARPCAPATATRTRGKADGGGGGREEAGGVADPVSLCSAGVGGGIAVHAPETPLISSQFVSAIFQPIANATTSRKPAEYRDLHAILPRGGGRREGGGWKEGEEGGVGSARIGWLPECGADGPEIRRDGRLRRLAAGRGSLPPRLIDASRYRRATRPCCLRRCSTRHCAKCLFCAIAADSFRAGSSGRLISPPGEKLRAARTTHERLSA